MADEDYRRLAAACAFGKHSRTLNDSVECASSKCAAIFELDRAGRKYCSSRCRIDAGNAMQAARKAAAPKKSPYVQPKKAEYCFKCEECGADTAKTANVLLVARP